MIDLSEKVALITGASRGIGAATAIKFAEAGARGLLLNYNRNRTAATQTSARCKEFGCEAIAYRCDVSNPRDTATMFQEAINRFGRLDVLVANAGIWKRAAIERMTADQWQETLHINLDSIYTCCHNAARLMLKQKRGTIILISSTAGQRGESFHSHYAATKGAIIAITKSLAAELGPRGITVNCVAPGWVSTDMTEEALNDPEEQKKIQALNPLGRVATPEEIAGPVLFLASSLASHINGEVLNVNGGSVLCG
ncbi:MAG TPA: SDR family NAD(P)-dependent oxidoreductase [Blastocatellia bacterium]|nr:SDR family NAD(P)-dependent oxidoreductase [Blastocatellia bacterium]